MTTMLAFGAFDPLHAGHAHFIAKAATHGDRLVVALASDDAIRTLKGHDPRNAFGERAAALKLLPAVDDIVPSEASDDFTVINDVQPDVIALGYDQDALRAALYAWMTAHRQIPIVTIDAHDPEKYKSSLLG